ncbi:MAG: NAD-dependent epimerase/dehydratase family protein [Bacillota bacterium]
MRIIVTGAGGRIGQWLVRALGERGDEVIGVDHVPPRFERGRFVPLDITDHRRV